MSDDLRFSPQEFTVLVHWMMASDPWPLTGIARQRMTEMLDDEAQARGFEDWVVAYHALTWEDDDE